MLDGATARTDTGCSHGVAWYANELGSALTQRLPGRQALSDILAEAILQVADEHRSSCDLQHPGTPSAAVGIARPTTGGRWECAVLGDITIVFGTSQGLIVVEDARISQSASAQRTEANRWPIGSDEKEAALVAMKHAELAERNKTYWIAASDPAAAYNAVTQTVDNVEQLAVLTDGAARVHTFGLLAWNELLDELQHNDPAHVIQRIRAAEDDDPSGQKWLRNKRSDDATIVYVGPAASTT